MIVRTLEALTSISLGEQNNRIVTGSIRETRHPFRFQGNQYGFFTGLASGMWNPAKREWIIHDPAGRSYERHDADDFANRRRKLDNWALLIVPGKK